MFKNHITVIEKNYIAIHIDIELLSSPKLNLLSVTVLACPPPPQEYQHVNLLWFKKRSFTLLSLENHLSFPQYSHHFCCAHLRVPADAVARFRYPFSFVCHLMFLICNRNGSTYKLNRIIIVNNNNNKKQQINSIILYTVILNYLF